MYLLDVEDGVDVRVLQGGEEVDEGVAGSVGVAGRHVAAVRRRSAQRDYRQQSFRFQQLIADREPLLIDPRT